MKKSITLVLCLAMLIMLSAVKGQNGARNSQSLLTEGNTWSVVECTGMCTSYFIRIEGDTLLNGNLYKKLVRSNDSLQTSWYFEAALREDTDGKIWRADGAGESLYYDFGLEAGDLFSTSVNGCQIDMQVESIETITLLNGESRTKINFMYQDESWIEGIGSTLGIANMGRYDCWFDIYFYLNCFTEDGILKYDDPAWDGCFHYSVGVNESAQVLRDATIIASPNPSATGEIMLEMENTARHPDLQLKVFDVFGKVIHTQAILPAQGALRLDTSGWNAGMYVAAVYSGERMMGRCKLMIK